MQLAQQGEVDKVTLGLEMELLLIEMHPTLRHDMFTRLDGAPILAYLPGGGFLGGLWLASCLVGDAIAIRISRIFQTAITFSRRKEHSVTMKPAISARRDAGTAAPQTVSSVPGRIRIRDNALRNAWLCSQLAARLSKTDGVVSLQTNSQAGSIVILYEPQCVDALKIEAAVDAALGELQARRPASGGKSTQRKLNRAAKVGMIGSLAASMALAASGNKRWHAATGGVFLCCLGVHLVVHRRHLIR